MNKDFEDSYEYEVDLRDYIDIIWDQKWLIVTVLAIAVVAATGYSLSQPSIYRTEATLLITPRVSEQIVKSAEGGLTSVSLPASAYERSALASDLLERIIKDYSLTGTNDKLISVASLKDKLEIDVDMKSSQTQNGSNLKIPMVSMNVRGKDPDKIKKITNRWAELFQQRTTELFSTETSRSYEFISGRFSKVKEELKNLQEQKLELEQRYPLQVLETEVKVLKNQYEEFLSSLETKKASLEEKKTRLKSLKRVLDKEPKYLTFNRSIPQESLWNILGMLAETSEKGATDFDTQKNNLSNFTSFKIKDQEINKVYFKFNEEKRQVEVDISSLKEEVNYLKEKLREIETKINSKQTKISKAKMEIESLDREINRFSTTYDSLSANLEEARIAKEEKESSIRVIESAVAPEVPIKTNTRQNVLVSGVLGLFIGILVAFFRNYMKETDKPIYDGENNDGESESETG